MYMRTKTIKQDSAKQKYQKENDLESSNHFLAIPENIQKTIDERWFYLYEWIHPQDVKMSIERDFLSVMNILNIPIVIIFVIAGLLSWFWGISLLLFFLIAFLLFAWVIIYICIISFMRSIYLTHNAYVVLTNSHVSIAWKIIDIQELNTLQKDIQKTSSIFEEELFQESHIHRSKKRFMERLKKQLLWWYKFLFRMSWRSSKDSWAAWLALIVLYTLYVLSIWFIYIFFIFILWCVWLSLKFINKKILLIQWHKVTKINDNFEKIDMDSKKLFEEKNILSDILHQALENDWKDWLLNRIHTHITKINTYSENAIQANIKLKNDIKDSQYNDIFNFSVYNTWIKKQIFEPLVGIRTLLEKNLTLLESNIANIEKQIENAQDESFVWPLLASKKRSQVRVDEMQKHIHKLSIYIDTLQ